MLYVGGNYNQNQNYGLFYLNGNKSASNTNSNVGSRILKRILIFWRSGRAALAGNGLIWAQSRKKKKKDVGKIVKDKGDSLTHEKNRKPV